jgi:hypothetical protein
MPAALIYGVTCGRTQLSLHIGELGALLRVIDELEFPSSLPCKQDEGRAVPEELRKGRSTSFRADAEHTYSTWVLL